MLSWGALLLATFAAAAAALFIARRNGIRLLRATSALVCLVAVSAQLSADCLAASTHLLRPAQHSKREGDAGTEECPALSVPCTPRGCIILKYE